MAEGISPTTDINQADYLNLFMQELAYQDPLKPIDNREFMAQMAQFSSLQEARSTNETLTNLLQATDANRGLMMLGKQVQIQGTNDSGRVLRIHFPPNSSPQLIIEINGGTVEKSINEVTSVL